MARTTAALSIRPPSPRAAIQLSPGSLHQADGDAAAHVGAASPGLRQKAAVEARAREAMAGGGQPGRGRRALAPDAGVDQRTAAKTGGREPELRELRRRGGAHVLAADLRTRLRLPLAQHDPQSGPREPGGRRRAGRTAADHQHVRALRHGALIRPTA